MRLSNAWLFMLVLALAACSGGGARPGDAADAGLEGAEDAGPVANDGDVEGDPDLEPDPEPEAVEAGLGPIATEPTPVDVAPEQDAVDEQQEGTAPVIDPDTGLPVEDEADWAASGELPSGDPARTDPWGDVPDCVPPLFVLANNVENLPTLLEQPEACQADGLDLAQYLATLPRAPDLFLVQQLSDREQARQLAATLGLVTGAPYRVIIAKRQPEAWAGANCEAKRTQTNAILYREDRLSYVAHSRRVWRSKIAKAGGCATASLDRNLNVAAKFIDRGANRRRVAVASIHWPVADGCGLSNAALADAALKSYANAKLLVFGGDANLTDLVRPDLRTELRNARYMPWYRRTNADLGSPKALGYRDAVWLACRDRTGSAGDLKDCLGENTTLAAGAVERDNMRRIDFVFARYAHGYHSPVTGRRPAISGGHTVTFAEANAAAPDESPLGYSEHRAVFGLVQW